MTSHPLTCIILEDEEDIRSWLKKKLSTFSELEIVGEADSVDAAYMLIASLKPAIAFMDIHLIGGNAFTLLLRLQANGIPIPYIVMATGHPDYAMQALNEYRHFIVQYLVKPFVENWRSNFRKAIDALMAAKMKDATQALVPQMIEPANQAATFTFIQQKGSLLRLVFDDVYYIESAGGGGALIVMDEGYLEVDMTLVKLEKILPTHFVRISRSDIVNIAKVTSVNRADRCLELTGGPKVVTLGLSDTYYKDFIEQLRLY